MKKIQITTIKETLEITGYTIKKLLDILPDTFIQCHRSYIVNKEYVEKIDRKQNTIKLKKTYDIIYMGEKYIDALRGNFHIL